MSCRGLIRRRCHFPTSKDDAARTEIQVSVTRRIQPHAGQEHINWRYHPEMKYSLIPIRHTVISLYDDSGSGMG